MDDDRRRVPGINSFFNPSEEPEKQMSLFDLEIANFYDKTTNRLHIGHTRWVTWQDMYNEREGESK